MAASVNELIVSWNQKADDWDTQVGDEGDSNRVLNSDPVLWDFLGEVQGLSVLDAGCGTGYLSRKLKRKGAQVTGVDLSPKMIKIARRKARQQNLNIDFRVDSCQELQTIANEQFDVVVANYVLMDLPDLQESVLSFYRVLKSSGVAVVIFSHPCFPQGDTTFVQEDGSITYKWEFSYFAERQQTDRPWRHFTSPFIWFHRPLSTYWKAFFSAGFTIAGFEEPRISEDNYHLAPDERKLFNSKIRPYSVAFKLVKNKI